MVESADIAIREERSEDRSAIADVTTRAFATTPYAGGDESAIIERMRSRGSLALSLVAVRGGEVVGQVTLSPAIAADDSSGWFALGPVAVDPALHRHGIGAALIQAAIGWMESRQASGCVLVGDPAYYARFRFVPRPDLAPEGQPAEYYQVLALACVNPAAVIDFDPAFFG